MGSSAIWDAIRGIFALFDRGIYHLINVVYEIIEIIAEAKIVEAGYIGEMANKLYSFIAIFMIFKISFSLINYLINPDSINDKEKGGAKLITNIVITFLLIILVPFGFSILREAQSAILSDDIIGTIVSGQNSKAFQISEYCGDRYVVPGTVQGDPDPEKNYKTGQFMALVTIRPFVQIDEAHAPQANIEALINETDYCKSGKVMDILSNDVINHDNSDNKSIYTIDYNLFVSTIVGGAILFILVSFTFDIAFRAVKLVFLEIIAPVPVMSYIDPSSSKKGLFSKWLKEVGVTWADLFLRLFAVTFSTSLIGAYQFGFGGENSIWIDIIILAGLLMFAKKLPDILKKLFNIDLKGDFQINPFKKFQDNAVGGKKIMALPTGLAGAAVGTIGTGAYSLIFNRSDLAKNLKNGFTKGFSTGFKNPSALKGLGGGFTYIKEKNKPINEAKDKLMEFDKFNKAGEKYFNKARLFEADGTPKYKKEKRIGLDGKEYEVRTRKYDIDETKLFDNQEYIDSFNEVKQAKKDVQKNKSVLQDAQTKLSRLNLNPNASEADIAFANAEVKKAQIELDKAEGVLTGKKERHKIIQNLYTNDAKKENALKEYMDRNKAELENSEVEEQWFDENGNPVDPPVLSEENTVSTKSGVKQNSGETEEEIEHEDQVVEANNSSLLQPSSDEGSNNIEKSDGSQKDNTTSVKEPNNEHHNEYKRYGETIRKLEKELEAARHEYSKYAYAFDGNDLTKRNTIKSDIEKMTLEINDLQTKQAKLIDKYPQEGIQEIQYEIDSKLEPQVRAANTEFKNAEIKINSFTPNGDMTIFGSDYMEADKAYDKANERRKDAESNRDKALDKINELQRKINSQAIEKNEKEMKYLKELENLLEEKTKINDELERMRKYYGPTYVNTSLKGKELQDRLYDIEIEIRRLKK